MGSAGNVANIFLQLSENISYDRSYNRYDIIKGVAVPLAARTCRITRALNPIIHDPVQKRYHQREAGAAPLLQLLKLEASVSLRLFRCLRVYRGSGNDSVVE